MDRREFLYRSAGLGAAAAFGARRGRAAAGLAPQAQTGGPARSPARGPLRVHPDNRRYFTDGSGKAIYLTGSHTWSNLVDMGAADPPERFDFDAYLDFLERYDHNFIRLWTWESTTWDTRSNGQWGKEKPHHAAPQPWVRTGPGEARDGKPKFDLTKFNADYFERLRTRVAAAGRRGIYVSIMLFEGWGLQFAPGAWESHPFHPDNNVNKLNGDVNGDGKGIEIHALASPEITTRQEAYVRKVVDTVNDLDNVLYEISNENHPASTGWQYHMIRYAHDYEKGKAKQHPVGMTFQYRGGSNRTLLESPADWISPNPEGGYRDDPPADHSDHASHGARAVPDGSKVILSDTDHLWGIGGSQAWVWKSFLRGMNPIFMDPYDGVVLGDRAEQKWDPVRRSLGYTLRYANRMTLAAMTPQNDLSSTGYCLAAGAKGRSEYLVYLPSGGKVTVDLSAAKDPRGAPLAVEWFNPGTGKAAAAGTTDGGARRELTAPFDGDAVVYLYAKETGR